MQSRPKESGDPVEHAPIDTARRAMLGMTAGAVVAAVATPLIAAVVRADPQAATKVGTFRGAHEDGIAVFRGIAYGTDTAQTRFAAPRAAPPSANLITATANGAACPQRSNTVGTQGEDCLKLNIWTPEADTRARLPVMVYVHGGAYATGSGNDPLTNGSQLATRGSMVVVTLSHRLNAFGYLYLANIEAQLADSGNVGQLDLVLALQWVRDHIAAFGGDAQNVTVFGQSGGGAKIATLMAMPQARNLFHKAATMSGQQITASGPINATRRAQAFLTRLGGNAADARTLPAARVVEALAATDPILEGALYFGPVLDNRVLHRHPFYPDAASQSLGVPLLLGNTVAETRAFYPNKHAKLNGLNWSNVAERLGPELRVDISPSLVVERYRVWFPEKSATEIFIAATTASRSWRGQIIEAELRAQAGAPAWVYQLDFENAKHTDDIGLVFGTARESFASKREGLQTMSNALMDTFIRFARTGDPGWPAYSPATRTTMIFDTISRTQNNPRYRERELFATVPYVQPGT